MSENTSNASNITTPADSGWLSWFGEFIWSPATTTIEQKLPGLPFAYDHKITHLIKFTTPPETTHTQTALIISDLDYQYLKYVANLPEVNIMCNIENLQMLKMTEFMSLFSEPLPSNHPHYPVICEFLNTKELYQYFGCADHRNGNGALLSSDEHDFISAWFKNIYSDNPEIAAKIDQVNKDSFVHALHWYPDFISSDE